MLDIRSASAGGGVSRGTEQRLLALVLVAACIGLGCGDDTSEEAQDGSGAHDSGRTGGRGGSGGSNFSTGGGGGPGGMGGSGGFTGEGVGGMYVPLPGCTPATPDPRVPDPGSDDCLRCLTEQCCSELLGGCGNQPESSSGGYGCYDYFFDCTRDCFDREVDAGSMTNFDELLVQCGKECRERPGATENLFEYPHRDFLACVAGQPRPTLLPGTDGEYIEGEADPDAGIAPNCIAQCLPSWR